MSNVYYDPEDFDLVQIVQLDWHDEAYSFDMTVIWQHKQTKRMYYASDSGCSCPSPFEDMRGIPDLTEINSLAELQVALNGLYAERDSTTADIKDAMKKVREVWRAKPAAPREQWLKR